MASRTSQAPVEVLDQSTVLKALMSQMVVEVLVPKKAPTWVKRTTVQVVG